MKSVPPALAEALHCPPDSFRFLRRSQNEVYAFQDAQGNARILRLTPSSHRSPVELEDELDWLKHLHTSGLSVCPPVPFPDGSLIVTAPDRREPCHGAVFCHARGQPLSPEDLGSDLDTLHGLHLGRLHAAARGDVPSRLSRRRPWADERYFTSDLDVYLPACHRAPLRELFLGLRDQLNPHIAPGDTGPVHLDLSYSNMFRNGDCLELFDFDNSARGPFLLDLCAALYGAVFTLLRCGFRGDRSVFEPPKTNQTLNTLWPAFLSGYRTAIPGSSYDMEGVNIGLELMFFRSVVHAFRLHHDTYSAEVRNSLNADVGNLLNRTPPLRFELS